MKRGIRTVVLLLSSGLLAAACAHILGIRGNAPQRFEHRAHVLDGIACVRCHDDVQDATQDSQLDLPSSDSCLECHSDPHDRRRCDTCHSDPRAIHALRQAKYHLSFEHATHQGPSQGRCVRCHHGIARDEGTLRPNMATCLGCHEHREQWAKRECGGCHRDMEGELARPQSHVVHGERFLDNHGAEAAAARDLCTSCHAESMCAGCHGVAVAALPQTFHFDRPSTPDMHGFGFAARHAIEARTDPSLCMSCHGESTCISCHRDRGLLIASAERPAPHPPGWIGTSGTRGLHGREARRDPMSCASCHGGSGEQLCVGCHRVGGPGGNPHPPGFSTRKPLSELPCRMCHTEAL